jgi:hypothetical protein
MIENDADMPRHLPFRDDKTDVITTDGEHRYWSTHCRHGNHDACSADELAPGVPRRPAQCKTCAAPCICTCHQEG